MAITLRGTKGSALTHTELDGNFTDLDTRLTTTEGDVAAIPNVTDGTANLDVSSIIINSSLTDSRPLIVEASGDNIDNVAKFVRTSNGAGAKSAVLAHADFSINATATMGSGFWTQFTAADVTVPKNISGMQGQVKSWTDEDNYTSEFSVYTWDRAGGITSFGKVLSVAQDETVFTQNTNSVTLESGVGLKLTPTAYADLPALGAGNSDNGKIAFLSTDGAGASQNKLIVATGGSWVYVDNPATSVATS